MLLNRSWFVLAALLPGTIYAALEVKRQATVTGDTVLSTSTLSLSSAPPTTQVITSVVTQSATNPTESNTPVTVVVTRTNSASSSSLVVTAFTLTGRLTTFTTTRPATVYTITGQTLVGYTSVITSTPGVDPTSSQAALNTGSSSSGSNSGGGLTVGAGVGLGVGIAVGVMALAAGVFIYIRRRRRRTSPLEEPGLEKDGVPVSELHHRSKPHEAGSTALHELQVELSELEDSNKDKIRRPPAELEGDEPKPK